jgi:hypothetical protein
LARQEAGGETNETRTVVDVGAWAALVLGMEGGNGSAELCRPIEQRSSAFGPARGEARNVTIGVSMSVPDQDLTRVHVSVHAVAGEGAAAVPPAGLAVLNDAVSTLLEPLRGLGGEATAAQVKVEVRCKLAGP